MGFSISLMNQLCGLAALPAGRARRDRSLDLDQAPGKRIEYDHEPLSPDQALETSSNDSANNRIIGAPTPSHQVGLFTRTPTHPVNSASRSRPRAVEAPHGPAAGAS
jgi:hypothetical protein